MPLLCDWIHWENKYIWTPTYMGLWPFLFVALMTNSHKRNLFSHFCSFHASCMHARCIWPYILKNKGTKLYFSMSIICMSIKGTSLDLYHYPAKNYFLELKEHLSFILKAHYGYSICTYPGVRYTKATQDTKVSLQWQVKVLFSTFISECTRGWFWEWLQSFLGYSVAMDGGNPILTPCSVFNTHQPVVWGAH